MRYPILGLAIAAALAACGGGGDDDDDGDQQDDGGGNLPTTPPTEVSMVASGGFQSPMDAVSSPDGEKFFFSGYTDEAPPRPAIFSVAASGGSVDTLVAGLPLEHPAGLLMSADGSTLYVADIGTHAGEAGDDGADSTQSVMYTLSADGGALAPLAAEGIAEASGMALGADGETLYITGFNASGQPGLFTLSASGGSASEILVGAPLESPSGIYVDSDNVAWVMDHNPSRGLGGSLSAITADGQATEVVAGLNLAHPGGVSLVAGGGTAVIPNIDDDGAGRLTSVNIESGEQTVLASPMKAPGGIRTARQAGVFAIADTEGDAVFLAR